ncbi:MAG: MATE family efflux transporter [Lachnospiraceae bacterium]|nr:MATE family efflux transporter [Lachnospiraceae bacterium]MDD3615716.1 MATE family efflux transporter [Lachnospiraceae bacterium]
MKENVNNSMTIKSKTKRWDKAHIETVIRLSIPAILAEISSVAMQYIDSAMVGSLGAKGTASIGLVSTSTWLISGLCMGAATGFSVQVAQLIGAGKEKEAQGVLRQSLLVCLMVSVILATAGCYISGFLPKWLGGASEIQKQASRYFFVYCCFLPAMQFRYLAGSMLQCSGNMRVPGILNASMCGLDVILNLLLIFPSRELTVFHSIHILLPGANLGVTGAALGSALSEVTVAVIMMWAVCMHSDKMRIIGKGINGKGSWRPRKRCMKAAVGIALPITFEHTVMCGAQVASTYIIAPLGTASVAANSLAVTAESFCYMPGYGIASAATTLVGQGIGAGDKERARCYARVSVGLGIALMSGASILMYLFAPEIFAMLTPDPTVRSLGTTVLRIEAFAEPLYGASIVVAGALRGAGDTLVPSILNLVSMWGVRISLSCILAPRFGLVGVWIAMCAELCVRGVLFLIRLFREKWLLTEIYKK